MDQILVVTAPIQPVITESDAHLFQACLKNVRDDMKDNDYIFEALRVLPVGGFRSAIGSFWNAVIDDLRNKVIHRSLKMFNKEMKFPQEIKSYEDFQEFVNDDRLIEGAYKIGVIGWEAHKVLKQSKETRHIFSGHPKSSAPSPIKVLSLMDDCIKYVLSQEYPNKLIDIDEYISLIGTENYDKNEFAIENTVSDLPERHKNELINRLFKAYVSPDCSTILRSNIEFIAPILWVFLPKEIKVQVVKRVDQEITKGNTIAINFSLQFVELVEATKFLTMSSKKYITFPLIKKLKDNLDEWHIENECVKSLERYSAYIPNDYLYDFIYGITQTYVGYKGYSQQWGRTEFYADSAAGIIPSMFNKFDDNSAEIFLKCIKDNERLRKRIKNSNQMRRLRSLGSIVLDRVSEKFHHKSVLMELVDEKKEKDFLISLNSL